LSILILFSDENYIDLDRMLAEKGGKFRKNIYDMRDGAGDGPTLPTKLHKCDASDPAVVEVSFFFVDFLFFNIKIKNQFRKSKIVVQKIF